MERNKTMKNKHITIVALAAAALATSCASEDIAEPQKQKQNQGEPRTVTLTASVNEAQTRVGMNKESSTSASFYWHNGDKISVLTTDRSNFYNAEFTTETEDGEASATFTGEVTGTVGTHAFYPYNKNHKYDGTTPYYNLPAEYTYDKVESNIFSKKTTTETEDGSTTTYPENPTNMPMLGTIADGKISFNHLGGLAVIRIDNMPATSGTLTVTADQQLSGDFGFSLTDQTPVIATTSTDTEADKKVTFAFSGASTTGVGVFYLPLATGSYTNLKIVIAYGDDNATTQTIPYGSLTVDRASVTAIPLSTDSKGNLRYIVKNDDGTYTINGHTFIDLGLSVLWAETNIGAEKASGYGNYYAWGEVTAYNENKDWGDNSVKAYCSWNTYKYGTSSSSLTKYNKSDSKTVLDKEDDAAYVNWGSGCRMPTSSEFEELDGCTWTWSRKTKCHEVKSTNGNSISLPASGYYDGKYLREGGSKGYYWSSTVRTDVSNAYCLYFASSYHDMSNGYYSRYVSNSVRPVAEP